MYYNIKPKSVPKGLIAMCFHPFGEVVFDNLANLEVNGFVYGFCVICVSITSFAFVMF